ncbi:hypothetical protein [Opitutus sp. ER46]|uniref:hypothetical protein n=1 Tax=Opitutus sp. ER46 TaxID=2161864 RepID=UPI000D318AF1|nr:hypothetical protein [Opitutus sp. ER46]PTX90958.1 hypothetical protein DB354_20115 [Opitutus sp. ER46]
MISKTDSFQRAFVRFLAAACLSVAAEPKICRIEGAFGLKLGDQFASGKAVGNAALTPGIPMYQFAPQALSGD